MQPLQVRTIELIAWLRGEGLTTWLRQQILHDRNALKENKSVVVDRRNFAARMEPLILIRTQKFWVVFDVLEIVGEPHFLA